MLAEDGVIQDNLLQELDELIGKVGGHEGLDRDRHLLGILRLRQGRLNDLPGRKKNNGELQLAPRHPAGWS